MIAQYPQIIPNSAGKPVRVETPEAHKRINPHDYQAKLDAIAADATGGRGTFLAIASAAEERERCAVVAETFPENSKPGAKPSKLGALIAAAIRGSYDQAFPRVLRNPESSPVKGDKFTAPGILPDTFIRADLTVNDPVEEAAARADGFTVLVDQTPAPLAPAAAIPISQDKFPKVLRDPHTEEKPDATHTEVRDGRYGRADVIVANPGEEATARNNGFTLVSKG